MTAYYNEIDPEAAQTLRNLIEMGQIAPGDVDERDIRDVRPSDLAGYTQCHFFAGIGIWSLALRNAGVADTRNVWTGSCPCQPFSAAGARGGLADERHLWPHWHWLIAQCRPSLVFGEQVASKDGLGWFDLVSADLEGTGYAVGAEDRCGPSVGAPHIRQRLWFGAVRVADSDCGGTREFSGDHVQTIGSAAETRSDIRTVVSRRNDSLGRVGDSASEGFSVGSGEASQTGGIERSQRLCLSAEQRWVGRSKLRSTQWLADTYGTGSQGRHEQSVGRSIECAVGSSGVDDRPDADHEPWGNPDWLWCRDNKFRPVEPGTFPLAHGLPVSMGKCDTGVARLAQMAGCDAASLKRAKRYRVAALRCYGNAIIEPVARQFIRDFHEAGHQSGAMRG